MEDKTKKGSNFGPSSPELGPTGVKRFIGDVEDLMSFSSSKHTLGLVVNMYVERCFHGRQLIPRVCLEVS